MSYSLQEYGRDLTPEERKEKALEYTATCWGKWTWYDWRRAVIDDQGKIEENYNRYVGAKTILNLAFDMSDEEIEAYCDEHVTWLHDDHALDVDIGPLHLTPWDKTKE